MHFGPVLPTIVSSPSYSAILHIFSMASIPRSEFVEGGISGTAVERADADRIGDMVADEEKQDRHDDIGVDEHSSMVWKAAFVNATTPAEVDLVLKNVREAELRYPEAVKATPSSDATPLVICMPLVRPSRSTKTGLPELSKQLFPAVKNPITPVLHGIVAPSKTETDAIHALIGPLMMTKPNLVIMTVRGQNGVSHASFFLETDKKEPNAYTYGFARLINGVVDDSAVVLVCGKHSPSRHMDTFAFNDVTKKFMDVDFGNDNCTADVKGLAAWFVVSVNTRIEDRYGLTMPNEAASNLTTVMSKRVDMFKLWGMRVPLCSRWHKSALERLENVGKDVVLKPRRTRKPKEVKTLRKSAPAPMRVGKPNKKRSRNGAVIEDEDADADDAEAVEVQADDNDDDDNEDKDDDDDDEDDDDDDEEGLFLRVLFLL